MQFEFPDIELRYLYVSRSSLYLPCLPEITPGSLISLTKTIFGFTNETSRLEVLENFVIPEVIEQIRQISRTDPGEDIFTNHNALSILSRYRKEQENLVLEYFIQEGLADTDHKAAVVDVRGTRTCHNAINSILSKRGYPTVKGFYLEVFENRKTIKEAGEYASFFYMERYNINSLNSFTYIYELGDIFEQYFSLSPHYRTIAYKKTNGSVKPVFEKSEIGNVIKNTVKCHEDVMALFSRLFISNKLQLHLHSVLLLSTRVLVHFSQKPVYRYLLALYPVKLNRRKGKDAWIVKRVSLSDIRKHNVSWWRGSLYFMLRTTALSGIINVVLFYVKKLYHRYRRLMHPIKG